MAEAMVGLFFQQPKSCTLVNAMRRSQHALCPQNDFSIAGGAGEADALVYQGMAQARTSGARLDKQQAKLRRVRLTWMLDEKHVTYVPAIHFGDPTPFTGRLEV